MEADVDPDALTVRATVDADLAAINDSTFDENLADDFVNSNPDCSFKDRANFLAQIAKPSAVKNIQCEDVRIRMLGEVAIIHARTTYIKPDGQPGAGRYTDVWAKRNGRWVCIAANVTRG